MIKLWREKDTNKGRKNYLWRICTWQEKLGKRERERDQKIPRLSYEGILGVWFM